MVRSPLFVANQQYEAHLIADSFDEAAERAIALANGTAKIEN